MLAREAGKQSKPELLKGLSPAYQAGVAQEHQALWMTTCITFITEQHAKNSVMPELQQGQQQLNV